MAPAVEDYLCRQIGGSVSSDSVLINAVSPELKAAVAKVGEYLQSLEARNIQRAQACLADGFDSVGPSGRTAKSVEGMVTNSSRRYRRIGKRFERFDALSASSGRIIVYCIGTLHGEWLDGGDFSGIRFIDRFELQDGLIITQEVWNDTGEYRLSKAAAAS